MKLVFNLIVVALVSVSASFTFAQSEDYFIDQFSSLEASQGYFYANDRLVHYSNYTLVQDYESDDRDQRLPMTSISDGDWILVYYNYSRADEKLMAVKILILPGSSAATSLMEELADQQGGLLSC